MNKFFRIIFLVCVVSLVLGVTLGCADKAQEHLEQGAVYRDQQEWDKAIEEYTKAIEINPKSAIAYNQRGYIYARLEQYEPAIADFSKAIELSRGDPEVYKAYYNRALMYSATNQYDKAIADFKIAITYISDEGSKEKLEKFIEKLEAEKK